MSLLYLKPAILIMVINAILASIYFALLVTEHLIILRDIVGPSICFFLSLLVLNYAWYNWSDENIYICLGLVARMLADLCTNWNTDVSRIMRQCLVGLGYFLFSKSRPFSIHKPYYYWSIFSLFGGIALVTLIGIYIVKLVSLAQVLSDLLSVFLMVHTLSWFGYNYWLDNKFALLWLGLVLLYAADLISFTNHLFQDVAINVATLSCQWFGLTLIAWHTLPTED